MTIKGTPLSKSSWGKVSCFNTALSAKWAPATCLLAVASTTPTLFPAPLKEKPLQCHCRPLAQPTGSLKVIIITDVKVNIERLSVAVSVGSEDIFVEGSVYTDGNDRVDVLRSIATKCADAG